MRLCTWLFFFVAAFALSGMYGEEPGGEPTTTSTHNATGMVPYTAFGGVRENINYSNGNLNLNVPLINLPGRNGLDLTLSLIYDSKIWNLYGSEYENLDNFTDTWIWKEEAAGFPIGRLGWRLNIPFLYAQASPPNGQVSNPCGTSYIAMTPDGSKHSFPNVSEGAGAVCNQSIDSQDAMFARLHLGPSLYSEAILTLKDGTQVYFPAGYGMASKLVDRNGNVISYAVQSDGSLNITDTVNRAVLLTKGSTGQFETITYKNSNGAEKSISLAFTDWIGQTQFSQPVEKYEFRLGEFPQVRVFNHSVTSGKMLSRIELPHDVQPKLSYEFTYNGFAELTGVKYPAGGETRYGYTGEHFDPSGEDLPMYYVCRNDAGINIIADFRQLLRRAVTATPGSSYAVTKYSPTVHPSAAHVACGGSPVNNEAMEVIDAAGNRTHYEFNSNIIGSGEQEMMTISGSSGGPLRTEVRTYTAPLSFYDGTPMGQNLPATIKTLVDNGLISKTVYTYDTATASTPNGSATLYIDNPLEVVEYGYGTDEGSLPILRRTSTTWSKAYVSAHILDLKLTEDIKDGPGSFYARTRYEYDTTPLGPRVATGAVQHELRSTPGDVTKIERWRILTAHGSLHFVSMTMPATSSRLGIREATILHSISQIAGRTRIASQRSQQERMLGSLRITSVNRQLTPSTRVLGPWQIRPMPTNK